MNLLYNFYFANNYIQQKFEEIIFNTNYSQTPILCVFDMFTDKILQ